MAVTIEDVLAVARLARLRLSDEEAELMTAQLNGILRHMRSLDELDVADAPPLTGTVEGGAPLRSDEPTPARRYVAPAELAPAWADGFFTVPRLPALDGGEPDGT